MNMEITKNKTMNTKKINLNISYNIEKNNFILIIEMINLTDETIEFSFSNDTGSLARNCIKVYDEQKKMLKSSGLSIGIPINISNHMYNISPHESEILKLKAEIEQIKDYMFLSFHGVSYLIDKQKKYYLSFSFLSSTSNLLEIKI